VSHRAFLRAGFRPGSIVSLLVLLAALGGCSSWMKTRGPSDAQRAAFHEHLALTAREISAADLDQAKAQAQLAREQAWGEIQHEKVTSLEHLIAGAEALQIGDAALAQVEWSRITDPALRQEVTDKARSIGIDVPPTAVANGKEGRR